MKTRLIAFIMLVAVPVFLIPLEQQIRHERTYLKYGGTPTSLKMRDQVGQGMAIALLAGFRGIVADFLWIQCHTYWEQKEWLRQYRNMELVTTLQPQSSLFWDLASWHMAWNISYAVRIDPDNHTVAEGLKRERDWILKGKEFLERGIDNIPTDYDLYFKLGWLYWQKLQDDCEAADYFYRACQFPETPDYIRRLYARSLERCGRIHAAYERWKTLWNTETYGEAQARNVVEREIRRLEDSLQIPNNQRVFPQITPTDETVP